MNTVNTHRSAGVFTRLLVAWLTALILGALTVLPVVPALAAGSGTWTPTGNLQDNQDAATLTLLQNGQGNTMTRLQNGQVLVAGGADGADNLLASAELYNPSTGTWTLTGSLPYPLDGFTATLLNNGQVLAAAGNIGGYIAGAELYDPSTGVWTLTGSLNQARAYQLAVLLQNGDVLVAGGAYNVYNPTYTAEDYTP